MIFRKESPDVISLGDAAVDLIAHVSGYPPLGADVEISAMHRYPGGSAANVAVAIARLGVSSGFIGKVGSDEAGKFLRNDLGREGVDVSHLQEEAGLTGTVIVLVDNNAQRTMLSFRGVNVNLTEREILQRYIAGSKLLHVSGYSLVHASQYRATLAAMKYAKEARVIVSLDPSPHIHLVRNEVLVDALKLVDVLLPNETEAKYLSHRKNLREAGRVLLRKGMSVVATKLGAKGCLVMSKGNEFQVAAFRVRTVDTTGAGDAYDAGFLVARLKGWDLKRSAKFANAVAALKITKESARIGLPRFDEVERFMQHEQY